MRMLAIACGLLLALHAPAWADPPARVARLGAVSGPVSFSAAGEADWDQADLNRPLGPGDRLWADSGARAELQVGDAMVRMDAGTGLSVLALDEQLAQVQLTQGTLGVHLRRLAAGQAFEIDTPNLAFTLRAPGSYRIEVDAQGQTTVVTVRSGQGEAAGDGAAYRIDAGQTWRFGGTDLRDNSAVPPPVPDAFERWADVRDRAMDASVSARYVSPDVVGYQDLDANGAWRSDPTYGNVWMPTHVPEGWAPYRDGRWSWVAPWGWTWVDDAPWGYAVSHYGRWASFDGRWGWVPGPQRTAAVYAPALVVFVGGANFQLAISGGRVGGVAWFPLGPREVYQPAYPVSRTYYENVNRSNTVINTTVITNNYNDYSRKAVTQTVYANRQVPGAIVAVPRAAFIGAQPVARVAVRTAPGALDREAAGARQEIAPAPPATRSAAAAGKPPPARVFDRAVIARTAPPPPRADPLRPAPSFAGTPVRPVVKVLPPVAATPPPLRAQGPAPAAAQAPGNVRAPTPGQAPGQAPAQAPAATAPQGQPPTSRPGERPNERPSNPPANMPAGRPGAAPADRPPLRVPEAQGPGPAARPAEPAAARPAPPPAASARPSEPATAARPADRPADRQADRPADRQADRPAARPAQPATPSRPADRPAADPPAARPAEAAAPAKPTKPAEPAAPARQADKQADKQAEKQAERKAEKQAEKQADRPAEKAPPERKADHPPEAASANNR